MLPFEAILMSVVYAATEDHVWVFGLAAAGSELVSMSSVTTWCHVMSLVCAVA